MADYLGQRFANYRLLRLLGKGSFADVYLGRHISLKTEVAIKIFDGRLEPDALHHFRTEVEHLRLLEHPSIMGLHEVGLEGDVPFLVMDVASGGTLRDRHPDGTILPLATVLSYVQPIASALDYAHAHRLVHRDLKPENLLFGRNNEIVLSDFGMALLLRSTDSMSMQGIGGTLAYMAPEQIRGKPGAASDQYALAIMVYEWLAGSRPFHGGAAELCGQHLFVSPPPLTSLAPDLSPLLERVLFKALAKDPGARFANVSAFANALEDASRGKAPASLFEAAPVNHASGANRTQTRNSHRKRILHLPTQLISLVGREAERKAACVLLVRPEVRLLTMTGPGGIGKTSLALSVADDMQDNFADGVCFVPLAAVHDPELVVPAIAEALEQQIGQRPILEIVQSYLRDKHLLLVLDNFEQVVQAAPSLSELLQRCPDLTIVVTSRESLRVQGEHEFPVPALDLPDLTEHAEKATLAQHAAIALFVERAQAINQAFRLTEENARAVAEICVRLDGLPLALELAAVQIKLWSPTQVLSRLSSRLHVLTGGRRDAPARQRTLRDAIKWSYDLLSASQQQLFRRLSIFVGGCSLEAIEELYRLLGDDPALVANEVASLLDKNVIKSGGHSREGIRILLLETIREFGLECLHEANEWQSTGDAHARFFVWWSRMGCQELFGPEQLLWMTDLMREMGNLRAVMRFVLEQGAWELALRLGGALGPLWIFLGVSNQKIYLVEGTHFLKQALDGSQGEATRTYARALILYGGLVPWLGEAERGEPACQEGVERFRSLGDLQGVIHGLWMLFLSLFAQCKLEAAHRTAQEAVELARQHAASCTWWGASWTLGYSLFNVGMVAIHDGRYPEGRSAVEEAAGLCARAGDRFFSIWSTLFLGEMVALEGKDEQAQNVLEQCLPMLRSLEMKAQEAEALRFLGLLALRQGSKDHAASLAAESVRLARETDDTQVIVWGLLTAARMEQARQYPEEAQALAEEGLRLALNRSDRLTVPAGLEQLGYVVATQDQPVWAVRLFGTAQALREAMGEPLALIDQQEYKERITTVRAKLDPTTFRAAWMQGRGMTAEQALAASGESLGAAPVIPRPTRVGELPAEAAHMGLTRREGEVLQLLAEGLTNAQIAERLVLSVATVNSYLRSIYGKLGVSTRAAATRYALDHHLV